MRSAIQERTGLLKAKLKKKKKNHALIFYEFVSQNLFFMTR